MKPKNFAFVLGVLLLLLTAHCSLLTSPAAAQSNSIIMKAPAGLTSYTDNTGAKVYPDALGHVTISADQLAAYEKAGFERLDYVQTKNALSGNLVFVVSPATLTTAHASAANRTVTVTLQNAAGETHTWYNRAVSSGVSIAVSSSAGTASIASTTLNFVYGVATVAITEGGTFAGADTDTLTIAAETIGGYTVASKTSVETFN
jgi:hypothetical protein